MPITIYHSYIKFNDNNTYHNVMAMAPNLTFTNTLVLSESFGLEDLTNGIFAPIGETYNGGVYIYATKIPENSITIPTIICWYA